MSIDMVMQGRRDWFNRLKTTQSKALTGQCDMLVELDLGQPTFERLKAVTSNYILAGLQQPYPAASEAELMALVDSRVDDMANRTPNGVLMPKKELEEEFHLLHRTVASYIQSLNIDSTISSAQCPIIVRLVKGSADSSDERRYASSKIHLDPWNGDPADEVIVSIPVLGDIDRTTVEFFHIPTELQQTLASPVDSYDEVLDRMGEFDPCPLQQRAGYSYFMDALIPHRTVKKDGEIRVTVEFRLRRQTTPEERSAIEEACDADRLFAFLNYSDWGSLGASKRMRFSDTYADAENGIFPDRPYDEPVYTVEDL